LQSEFDTTAEDVGFDMIGGGGVRITDAFHNGLLGSTRKIYSFMRLEM
jgi:hypothetical protein